MGAFDKWEDEEGGLRGSLILWLLGVPLPLIFLFYLFRGC